MVPEGLVTVGIRRIGLAVPVIVNLFEEIPSWGWLGHKLLGLRLNGSVSLQGFAIAGLIIVELINTEHKIEHSSLNKRKMNLFI